MLKEVVKSIPNGTRQELDGKACIFYDGYWIRRYEVPVDEDAARRELGGESADPTGGGAHFHVSEKEVLCGTDAARPRPTAAGHGGESWWLGRKGPRGTGMTAPGDP